MASNQHQAVTPELKAQIFNLAQQGLSNREIGRTLSVHNTTVGRYRNLMPAEQPTKKVGEFNIDEWMNWMEAGQKLKKKASFSQHSADIVLGDGKSPQVICPQGDWHIASWGTDHSLVRSTIKEIQETENAWFPLMGDMIQMSIKMRNVLEVSDNMIPPELQTQFLAQLMEKIVHKVPFSVWCNHGVEREEAQSGISMVKHVLSRKSVYFNGIGHPNLRVGEQTYKFAANHKWRGNSMYDTTYAMKRYARMEANDREVILGADNHRPGFSVSYEGGMKRVAMRTGTFQTSSGYAQRYFSLRTWPEMPAVVLHHDAHLAVPFENLDQALKYIGQ